MAYRGLFRRLPSLFVFLSRKAHRSFLPTGCSLTALNCRILIGLGIILVIPLTPKGWKLRSRHVLFFAALQHLLDTGTELQTGELGEWLRNVIVTPTLETLFLVPSTTQCSYS